MNDNFVHVRQDPETHTWRITCDECGGLVSYFSHEQHACAVSWATHHKSQHVNETTINGMLPIPHDLPEYRRNA